MTKFINKLKNDKHFIVLIILLLISLFKLWYTHKDTSETTTKVVHQENTSIPQINTTTVLTATPKATHNSPDLVVSTKYKAEINGQIIEVPLKSSKETNTYILRQTVDVSDFIKDQIPTWSVGIGVGYRGNEVYYPLSVERSLDLNKAVRFEVHLDKTLRHSEGVEVHYVYRF